MDNPKCCSPECANFPIYICNIDHIILCHEHGVVHLPYCNQNSFVYIRDNIEAHCKKIIGLRQNQGSISEPYKISTFYGSQCLFYLDIVPMRLTCEYKDVLNSMTNQFIAEIYSLPNGKSEKVASKCFKFVRSLKNIILNFEIDHRVLTETIISLYSKYHSCVEGAISSGLIALLSEAQRILEMPSEVTNLLFQKKNFEAYKQEFIFKYLTQDNIKIEDLSNDFYKKFKPFIKSNSPAIPKLFDGFEISYRKVKKEVTNDITNKIQEFLYKY